MTSEPAHDATTERTAIRVVVADDHPVFRSGLRTMVEEAQDLEFVGEARDGQEALELCRATPPDVVLMDLRMPNTSGVAATAALAEELPARAGADADHARGRHLARRGTARGARGYVLKGAAPEEILRAVRAVAAGQAILDLELADRLPALSPEGNAPIRSPS